MMDEDDIFPVICPKKTYSKPIKKVKTFDSNDVEKTSRRVGQIPDTGVPLTTKVAVEYLLNGKLKSSVCRYCLKVTVGLSELDQIMQIAGTGVLYKLTIREMIACFYPFKARQEESFPEKICQKCLDRAINAYLFTQQCEQAERALHNCFDDINEKFNKLDPIDKKKRRGRQKLNPNTNTLYAEHHNVIDYAEPLRNIINLQTESLSNEPDWNEFECKKCWQVLPDLESLLNHEQIHPKSMWYHCRLCGKSFVKINQLKKHFNQVHVRGKGVGEEVDKTFKCKECGNVTENYIQHLQHIEKHKFKSIMKHLIEKKTDQLCLVCLKKSSDLVELDKMVCVHGSCPELVGDKSLYTVLASTLPDQKSYKYQELHVPRKADIMIITERKRKSTEIQNIPNIILDMQFELSLPEIITKDRLKTNDFYYYVFSEPNTIDCNTQETKRTRIFEITDEETMDDLDDKMPTVNEGILVFGRSTGDKIPVYDKELLNLSGNYNQKSEMVMEETGKKNLNTFKNVVENEINQKKLLEDTSRGGKNVTGALGSVDLVQNDSAKSLLGDKEQQIIDFTDKFNVKNLINAAPMDLVVHCIPDEDNIFNDVREPINFIERDESDDISDAIAENRINEKSATVLIDQNRFENPKFIFSNPITVELVHNIEADITPMFNLSNPGHADISRDQEIKVINIPNVRPMKVKTELSWIFNKASDNKYLFKNNELTDNKTNAITTPIIEDLDCKFCWIFKHLNKCGYCKMSIDTDVKIIDERKQLIETDTFNYDKTNNNIEKPIETATFFNKSVEVQTKPIKNEINAKERKTKDIWQCNVCLTINNNDRSTCNCCESKKEIENGNCKVTFGNNKTFFFTTHENENKNHSNIEKDVDASIQETKPFAVIDEATMMDTKFTVQNNSIELQMDNISNIHNMDMETDSVNYALDTIHEEMDVEEESFIPNPVHKFDQPILAAKILPHVGTNIQFNIGSNPVQHEKGARKIKRAVRNLPKAFHK